jgi:hypothetical protein
MRYNAFYGELPLEAFKPIGGRMRLYSGVDPISAVSDAISSIGDIGQGAINAVSDLGVSIDQTVRDVLPGGWTTAALLGAGYYYAPEIGAYMNATTGSTVPLAEVVDSGVVSSPVTSGVANGVPLGELGSVADEAPFVNPTNITPISQVGNITPGELGSGTFGTPGDVGTDFVTTPAPANVGQLTGGASMTPGSFNTAATGAIGAGLGGAATDAMGDIIPANAGNAAGTAAAAISSGAVPGGLVNDGGPGSIPTGTGLSSLLTPANVLLGKGLLDTVGSNKVISGINSAAATQQAAYEQSKKDLAGLYANQQSYQKPYMATGTNALSNLGALGTGTYQMYDEQGNPTGTGTGSGYLQHQFDASDLAKGLAPNYDFMLQQGQMANQRAANMAGGGFGGNALQGLNRYTQDYAGNAYQNAFTNYQNQRQNIFGNLSNLAGIGQGATKDLTAATGAYGTNLTNLNVGNAAAQAAAQVAAAQQGGTNLSNLGNTAVVASLLNQNPGIAQTPVA